MRSTSVILPTVYGPGDSFAENSHVVGALVGKFVRASADKKRDVEVWGDGTQEREFLLVEDAVAGILCAAKRSESDILNIGTGTAYSISHIAATIRAIAQFEGEIRFNTSKFVGVRRRVLDVSKIRDELRWVASTSLEDGLTRTIRWYETCTRGQLVELG